MRSLHEGQLLVRKVANHASDEVFLRHVVRVEDDDEIAVTVLEGVVEVSCLGVLVVGASEVEGAQFLRERLDFRPPAVIEHVGAVRVVQAKAGLDGGAKQVRVFIVSCDEYIHRSARQHRLTRRFRDVPDLQEVQQHHGDAVDFPDK